MVNKIFKYFSFFIISVQLLFSQYNEYNCFSILVGKNVSVDGSVLFAHNEDDSGINLVNWYKVPGKIFSGKDSIIILIFAGRPMSLFNEAKAFFKTFF